MFTIPATLSFKLSKQAPSYKRHPLTNVRETGNEIYRMFTGEGVRSAPEVVVENIPRTGWTTKGMAFSDYWLLQAPPELTHEGEPLGWLVDISELSLLLRHGGLESERLVFIEDEKRVYLINERDLQHPEMQALKASSSAIAVDQLSTSDLGMPLRLKNKKTAEEGFLVELPTQSAFNRRSSFTMLKDGEELFVLNKSMLLEVADATHRLNSEECLGHVLRSISTYDRYSLIGKATKEVAVHGPAFQYSMLSESHLEKYFSVLSSFSLMMENWSGSKLVSRLIELPENIKNIKVKQGKTTVPLASEGPKDAGFSFAYPLKKPEETVSRAMPLIYLRRVRNIYRIDFERCDSDVHFGPGTERELVQLSFKSLSEMLNALSDILDLNHLKLRAHKLDSGYIVPSPGPTFFTTSGMPPALAD